MRISSQGIELIKHFEQLHDGDLSEIGLQPKKDPIGIWTVGWGRALRDPETGVYLRGAVDERKAYAMYPNLSEEEAEIMLQEDLNHFEQIVLRKVKRVIKQHEFDALVSHTYNTGGSTSLFQFVSTDAPIESIVAWFRERYITGDGKKLAGLVRRRRAESKLYEHGILDFS